MPHPKIEMFLEKHARMCYNQSKANDFYCGGVFAAASKRSMYSAIPEILLFKTQQTTKQQEMQDGGSGAVCTRPSWMYHC